MKKLFLSFWRDSKGVAAVEMAWVGVFMGLMMIPAIDLADATLTSLKLGAAVDSGVLYALKNPSDTSGMTTVIQRVGGLDATKLSVEASNFCECNGGAADCSATCNAGMEKYMTIHAGYSRPLMFNYPGIDNPYLISRERAVRVQ